jgi:hypothetical protein
LLFRKGTSMKKRQFAATVMLTVLTGSGWAQSNGGQQSTSNSQQGTPTLQENPPITGLDQPSLEPGVTARSFLIPGLHFSESADSNVGDSAGGSSVQAVTRAFGSLMLQRMSARMSTDLDYVGGVAIYPSSPLGTSQVQQLSAQQKFYWHRGQLAIRNEFSYLPEGAFGFGVYGESAAYDQSLGGIGYIGEGLGLGIGGLFGPTEFGSLGQQSRYTNLTVVDIVQQVSSRSAITLAGGYGLVHFTDNTEGFIDSNQVSAQAGYDYQLTRKDELAAIYGFQEFHYPNFANSTFTTHLANVLYGHRISGRMDVIVGAGPQVTIINSPLYGGTEQTLSLSAQASLRYRFQRTSVGIFYDRVNTSGSGYFLGATSDVVRVSLARPLTRVWNTTVDVGYARNSRVQPGVVGLLPETTSGFWYLYAGAAVQRKLGHNFDFFISYQYNNQSFNNSGCFPGELCNPSGTRQVGSVGLDWHPHPIRLD